MRARWFVLAGLAAILPLAACGDSGSKSNRVTFWCGEIETFRAANADLGSQQTATDPAKWKVAFTKTVTAANDAAADAPADAKASMTTVKDFYVKLQALAEKHNYAYNDVAFDPDFSTLENDQSVKSASAALQVQIRNNCPSATTVPAATTTVAGPTATTAASASTT